MKKVLAVILSLLLLVSLLPAVSYAAQIVESGMCGENVSWTLDSNGLFTISGKGMMDDWFTWEMVDETIKTVVIQIGVTNICDGAFDNCYTLTSITIPNSVTEIGKNALHGCSGLTSVTIPNSVTEIGESAFSCCTRLTSVTIPNSVTKIGSYVFSGCTGLTSVTIPNSVTEIGEGTFSRCTRLKSATVPNSFTYDMYIFSGCSALADIYYSGAKEDWEGDNDIENVKATMHWHVPARDGSNIDGNAIQISAAKELDGILYVVPGLTAGELLKAAGTGAKLINAQGSAVKSGDSVASGMTLTKAGGKKAAVIVKGDNDGDGGVTTNDARNALRAAVGLDKQKDWQTKASLIVSEIKVGTADARMILRSAIGLEKLNIFDARTGFYHQWECSTTKYPTCGAEGKDTYMCVLCGKTNTQTIPATGEHNWDWDDGKYVNGYDCTKDCIIEYTCKDCGATIREIEPAWGEHEWDEGEITKEPTKYEPGEITYSCEWCDATYTEIIPATGKDAFKRNYYGSIGYNKFAEFIYDNGDINDDGDIVYCSGSSLQLIYSASDASILIEGDNFFGNCSFYLPPNGGSTDVSGRTKAGSETQYISATFEGSFKVSTYSKSSSITKTSVSYSGSGLGQSAAFAYIDNTVYTTISSLYYVAKDAGLTMSDIGFKKY